MKITWLGHSCFKIEKDGYILIIDPYVEGSVPGLLPVAAQAHQVLCSHEHGDHNGRSEVELLETPEKCPFSIDVLPTYHDDVQGAKRGNNQMFLISDGKSRIAHLGDLGCHPTKAQMDQLRNLDAIMIPVGGYYTIDGKQAAELVNELKPRIVVPMHYRDDEVGFGYAEIEKVKFFTEDMDSVITLEGSELDIEGQKPAQVIILQPERRENR